jgi:hypothetical protein
MAFKDRARNIIIGVASTKAANFFFPVGDNSNLLSGSQSITPIMESDAKKISNYFAPVQLIRYKTDTSMWRQAIKEMEYPILPYRVSAQRIFQDVELNGHVKSCMQKRKNLTLLKNFHICDESGKTNDEATKLIKKQWFQNAINYILDAQAFGYSLIGFGDVIENEFPNLEIIRRANISPDRLILSPFHYIPSGIPFMDANFKDKNGESFYDWSLYVPTPSDIGISKCGYGYLYSVARYEIILRALDGWNTTYCEIFGQPFRWGRTNKEDEERKQFETELARMGAEAWIVTDKDEEIDFINGDSAGTGWKSYENLEVRKEKIITSIILGHKDAMSASAGKMTADGQDSPQSEALRNIESTDSRFVEHIVNDFFIPKLINLGIKIPIGTKFEFKNDIEKQQLKESENKNNKAVADIAYTMSQAGLSMPADYFEERTGIRAEKITISKTQDAPQFSAKVKTKLLNTYA